MNVPLIEVSTGTVKPGDTVAKLLQGKKVAVPVVYQIEKALQSVFDTRRIQPGHTYELETSTSGIFGKFTYHAGPILTYVVNTSSSGVFSTETHTKETSWSEKKVVGEVTNNIYQDLLKQGYDETFVANLVVDLADNVFGWRIDFFTEQRPGDQFEILVTQEYIEGSNTPLSGHLKILAASYTGKATRKKENYAIRYRQPDATRDDYFDLEGNAVRKAFLRAPFTHGSFRLSSGFSSSRFHPILRVYRPHHGTDYAASIGTPVSAIGNGKVIYAGWKSGYGNCIEIRHNNKYVSRYGHLSKIAVRLGGSIAQGQYIGRVGNTGLSTGPHLHFEMLIDGTQRNFLKMDFPSAASVSKQNMPDFSKTKDNLLARLKNTPQDIH